MEQVAFEEGFKAGIDFILENYPWTGDELDRSIAAGNAWLAWVKEFNSND